MAENKYDPLAVDRSAYPSNKKVKERESQLVKAEVLPEKKARKVLDTIFSGDFESLKEKLIFEVFLPGARDFIAGGLKNAIDMAFYGKASSGSYTPYNRMSSPNRTTTTVFSSASRVFDTPSVRDREIEKALTFSSREDAYAVMDKMQELISEYGQVSVLDLCDITGVDCEATDNRYGWKDLRLAVINKKNGRWVIDLPRTRVLG